MVAGSCDMRASRRETGATFVVALADLPESRALKSTRMPLHCTAIRALGTCRTPVGKARAKPVDRTSGFLQSYGELICTCIRLPGLRVMAGAVVLPTSKGIRVPDGVTAVTRDGRGRSQGRKPEFSIMKYPATASFHTPPHCCSRGGSRSAAGWQTGFDSA